MQGGRVPALARPAAGSSCWWQTARVGSSSSSTTSTTIVLEQSTTVTIGKESNTFLSKSKDNDDDDKNDAPPSPSPPSATRRTTTPPPSLENAVDWMEFLEQTEHREQDEGGAGAYDTMRCDVGGVPVCLLLAHPRRHTQNDDDDDDQQQRRGAATRVVIWGQDFHVERLQHSYLSLVRRRMQAQTQLQNGMDAPARASPSADVVVLPNESALKQAIQQSKAIIGALLDEAVSVVGLPPVLDPLQSSVVRKCHDDTTSLFFMVRVTLLWSYPSCRVATDRNCHNHAGHPPQQPTTDAILVRGHATSSLQPMNVYQTHDPIVVSVVVPVPRPPVPSEDRQGRHDDDGSVELPNRFQSTNPHDKVASWCRLRKQLELPTYKPPEAAEVLMVRSRRVMEEDMNHHRQPRLLLEILEGLSSNFFVIYKDGTLRTATEGVLCGYVRHLVLESAHKVGLTFDPRPIYLQESKQWQECFITSSSRLIWPISKIMQPAAVVGDAIRNDSTHPSSFVELWKSDATANTSQPPKWHELFKEILKAGGYYSEI